MDTKLSILGCPHAPDGSGYYRFYLPYKHLARGVDHRIMLPPAGERFLPTAEQVDQLDLIAGQRFVGPDGVALWEQWKKQGVKLVLETDDDVLQCDTSSGLAHWFDPEFTETYKQIVGMSDLVTVSTEPLADEIRKLNKNVAVLPNHVDSDLLYHERPRRERLTVGWQGGGSHLIDWMEAAEPVGEILRVNPDVDMHFVGIDYSPLLRKTDCRYTPWRQDVWAYFKGIDFDIGLAPLADTPFNRSKSWIKALEYMAMGIPVIASDQPAYRDLVQDGVTGYLVRTVDEWKTRLIDLINDEDMRAEMGAAGKKVASGWTIQTGWKLWRDAYEGLF